MKKQIILKNYRILSAAGNLEQTCDSLYNGISSIKPGPCFGVNVPHASFNDITLRTLENAIHALSFSPSLSGNRLLFIFAAAKGELTSLEQHYRGDTSKDICESLLYMQCIRAVKALAINPVHTVIMSSACASGAVAIDYAKEQLTLGRYSDVIIFAFDTISEFVVKGFNALNALSPEPARPFDKTRNGLTLGDGAALVHLTYENVSPGDIVICGSGTSNDANHRTGPSRTGDGLHRAITFALDDAHITPDKIAAVKCHGTATNYNDAMEAKAIFSTFGENIPPTLSLKGAIGHTSGAGSLLEICLCAEFVKQGKIPPTIGFSEQGVDEPVKISASCQNIDKTHILCLSAGFGGLNCAVILKEVRQ
ncbi:MAG: beta-ketoacyl synthase N-terminal-like domain-containing protein [Fibrobacterota bacterium]